MMFFLSFFPTGSFLELLGDSGRLFIMQKAQNILKAKEIAEKAGIDMAWSDYFTEDSGWGKKLGFDERKGIYSFFYEKLEALDYPVHKISLCKETTEMWKELGYKSKPKVCNCYGPSKLS